MQRFAAISSAAKNGTSISTTTRGSSATEEQRLSPIWNGSRSHTNEQFLERLATLATTPRGPDAAPLETYRTTSTEHGQVYSATLEYVDWLRRRIPGYGECRACPRPAPRREASSEGEIGF